MPKSVTEISSDDRTRKSLSHKIYRFVNSGWFTSQILRILGLAKIFLMKVSRQKIFIVKLGI